MATGKWIPNLTSETPTVDAARRSLSLRLESLREALGTALQGVDDELENVHQLRVACRRATATVELFEQCIPRRAARQARKVLRTYRRIAGEARDWDVMMLSLAERLKAKHEDKAKHDEEAPGIDLLFGYAMSQRITAQERLETMCPGYPIDYELWMTSLLSSLQECPEMPATVANLARAELLPKFESLWEEIDRPNQSWKEMHDTRISAKRLRYMLEIVGAAFPAVAVESIYRRLSELQSILGDSNDGFVGCSRMELLQRRLPQLFRQCWPRWSPLLDQMRSEYRKSMRDARDRFEHWKHKVARDELRSVVRNLLNPAPPLNALDAVCHEAG